MILAIMPMKVLSEKCIELSQTTALAVQDKFQQTAIAEMKHAEKIAERLWYLGGTPTTKPAPIEVGKSMKEFLKLDTKAEVEENRDVPGNH